MRSVYFYTFHKCASSLFADYVLQHVHGLTHVDYSGRRFLEGSAGEVCFEPQGYVYGPIRVLATLREARWESAVCVPEFVRDKRAIFMVRDPRDLLVSQYYSTAFSHAISPVPEIRDRQLEARRRALRASVDAFALKRAGAMARKFDLLGRLAESC